MKAFRVFLLAVTMLMLPAARNITQVSPSAAAMTPIFQKGGGGATVVVTGTLVAVEGVECYMIMLENYHLIGNLQGFGPGDTVTVTGATDIESFCQQGIPLRVISITAA